MSCYVEKEYYLDRYKGTVIPVDKIEEQLTESSMHIDSLTYNRIVKSGIENLTKFQKDIIQKVVCRLGDFEYENEDIIKTILSSYSINGVSMGFRGDNWNIEVQNGIAIQKSDYYLLMQTGLTCRNMRC